MSGVMRQYDSTTTAAADKSFGKKEKTIKLLLRGGPHGGCFQDFEICHNNFAEGGGRKNMTWAVFCLLYTSLSPRDGLLSRMPSSA